VSELPRGWVATKLGEIATPRGERVPPAAHPDKQFVGLEHVESQTTRILGSVSASEVKSSASLFRAGDVLYGRLRPYLNKVAKPDFDGLASAEFIVFPDQAHLRSGFLKHRLNAGDFASFATHLNAGDRPRVDFEQIGAFGIALPPPAEQQRIVEKLDELLSDLDAGTAALERARANLKRYRAAVLKAAVEGRLTRKWRAMHPAIEPAARLLERILAERRKKWEAAQVKKFGEKGQAPPKGWKDRYVEPAKPDVVTLPELPEGWCWATLEQLLERSEYGTSVKCGYDGSHEPVLRIPNIAGGRIDLSDMKRATASLNLAGDDALQPGDLLVCRTNGSIKLVGKAALVEVVFEQPHSFASYLLRMRFLLGVHVARWVWLFLTSQPGRSFIEGHAASSAGQHNVSLSLLHGMPIPLAPFEEQRAANAEVDRLLSVQAIASRDAEVRLRHAGVLRQSILKRAFEGRLVPQRPNDEPASELLKRIRMAREAEAGKRVEVKRREARST
jgi:type I restriction enzyme, S subunit